MRFNFPQKFALNLLLLSVFASGAHGETRSLFGYRQIQQLSIDDFPQWVAALERHLRDDLREGDCASTIFNRCHLGQWLKFLADIENLSQREQIERVNAYANNKSYILDIHNYRLEDYWAIPREFLYNGGDCEDFAITKFFSLRWLGHDENRLRIVIIQDTNLRVPHAVLAVDRDDDYLILDNQVSDVLSHERIVHYAPVYSINQEAWWLHLPE